MQAKIIKHIFYLTLLLLISGVVAWQTENIYLGILAFFIVGLLLESGDWVFDHVRMRTQGFFANLGIQGHSSIIDDDVLALSSPYEEDIEYTCFRPGGSSVYWLPFHGMDDIYIIRSDLVDREDGAILAIGDYYIPAFTDLPLQWQRRILQKFGEDRTIKFSPKSHKVFYAETRTANDGIISDKDTKGVNYGERFLMQESIINSLKRDLEDVQSIRMSSLHLQKAVQGIEEKNENRKEE